MKFNFLLMNIITHKLLYFLKIIIKKTKMNILFQIS
jgi:hypothetical protein